MAEAQHAGSAQNTTSRATARVLGPQEGETVGKPGILHDRFMVNSRESGGGFALVEHLLPPRTLAAPLHRHSREDEYSYVLEGRVGAQLGEDEVFGEAGDLIFKPRGQWHTFWNAGARTGSGRSSSGVLVAPRSGREPLIGCLV
jgi:quercetin dioxygenase-like cupin family protein